MKLYDYSMAPNARRVRAFAAEKGMSLDMVTIDLSKKEQLKEEFRAMNPRMSVPVLELDNGTLISESVAICRYLDEIQPEPNLFGEGPEGKATVEMWHRRVELEGMQAAADGVRNSVGFFAGRAIAGPTDFAQIPELAERGRARLDEFYRMLDERLASNEYVAGDKFSIADIAALVTCDFAKVLKKRVGDDTPNLKRWYESVSSRPSAKA